MIAPGALWRRVRGLGGRRAIEDSMDAEMRYHIECETEARVAMGMSPEDARRTAMRDFGGVERHKEAARDERGFRGLWELLYDARHVLRTLRRNPGYTAATLLTFALGIGFATAIFSVVNGVLLRPLPFARPDRLVVLWERNASRSVNDNVVSVGNFEAWRDRARSFQGTAAMVPDPVTFGGAEPERIMGADVSPGFFHLLGVSPALGRDFLDEDVTGGTPRTVILSDGLWRRKFGADPGIVGRAITLGGSPMTVVGVMPAGFDPPKFGWMPEHELWLPFAGTADNRRWGRFLLVVGRLRDGATLASANRELGTLARMRESEDPSNTGWSATIVPLATQITGQVRRPLLVLLAAVGLLLAMAATNVASLMLGFMRRRETELAVRQALGASRGRIARQLMTHALVLGGIASGAGIAAAVAGTRILIALMPADVPRAGAIGIDMPVLLFATAVGLAASLTCGAAVAMQRTSAAPGIGSAVTGRMTRRVARGSLVTAEIALGVVLTILAGLMIRSFANLRAVNLGFDATNVVTARLSVPYTSREQQRAFFEMLGERVRAIPGVEDVSFATTRPFTCCAPATEASDPSRAGASGAPTADIRYADAAYFSTLRVPIVAGQNFAARELPDGPPHAVINQTLARTLWPDENPIGRSVHLKLGDWRNDSPGTIAEVVGVAADVHLVNPRTEPRATVYLSATRFPSSVRDVIVRANGAPDAVIAALRNVVRSTDPTLPLYEVTTLRAAVDRSLARDRFTMIILAAFAAASLLLTGVGVYSVFAADVVSRRKEIGVRVALGARGSRVVSLLVGRAVRLALLGAAIGVAAAYGLARSMSTLVYGIQPTDPASFAGVTLLLLDVAMIATLIPAIRATRASPLDAIRTD